MGRVGWNKILTRKQGRKREEERFKKRMGEENGLRKSACSNRQDQDISITPLGAEYNRSIAPSLPGVSAILTTVIICFSIGMESRSVAASPDLLLRCLAVQGAFYLLNYFVSVLFARCLRLGHEDGLALLYTTVLRNLAISIGIAADMFGSQAAFMVSIAFLIQPLAAAWFLRANRRWNFT